MGTTKQLPALEEYSFDLPIVLDSTQILSFRSCPFKFFLNYMNHIRGGTEVAIPLHFGGVVAAGLEAYRFYAYAGLAPMACFEGAMEAMIYRWGDYEIPEGDKRTFDKACLAVHKYFQRWPALKDPIKPIVHGEGLDRSFEYSFAVELLPSDGFPSHPSGDNFILGGRADLLGNLDAGDGLSLPVLEDDKTTLMLGQTWADQWPLRHQFMLYLWCLRRLGYPQRHVIVRGIGIKVRDVDLVDTPPIHFSDHLLDKFEHSLKHTLRQMVAMYYDSYTWGNAAGSSEAWEKRFGNGCMAFFRPCEFQPICSSTAQNEFSFVRTIRREEWDPLGVERVIDDVKAVRKQRNLFKLPASVEPLALPKPEMELDEL